MHMVARDEVFRLAARCTEDPGFGVVRAVGQKLQREKWVRRPALSQVDLNRVDLPLVVVVEHCDEVERKASEDTLFLQTVSHLERFPHDLRSILGTRRKATAQVRLPAR